MFGSVLLLRRGMYCCFFLFLFFFFKQKTAYEMRISDWSSDVCSSDLLAAGGRVELRGFGAFSTRARESRTGRNPRTGAAVDVKAKSVPYFKPGKEMRERLNG